MSFYIWSFLKTKINVLYSFLPDFDNCCGYCHFLWIEVHFFFESCDLYIQKVLNCCTWLILNQHIISGKLRDTRGIKIFIFNGDLSS